LHLAVINAGTATLKAALAEVGSGGMQLLARAEIERGGEPAVQGVAAMLEKLAWPLERIDVCAHRFVHGGSAHVAPALLDAALETELEALSRLAPLHTPVALACARAARALLPRAIQVAVFDTAFHGGRAPESQRYALPWDLADALGIHRFGFHGIAHESLLCSLARARGGAPEAQDAVTLQLGAGCSACAIGQGRSLETSMGFTPLEGLVMATRSGDVDPGALLALLRSGRSTDELERILTRESGLLGMAGSDDLREVLRAEARGSERARVAVALFVRRIVMTVGAYLTLLDGRGALVFGGGIGERSAEIRARVAAGLRAWNIELDAARNVADRSGRISRDGSREVFVFATDEESVIARAAADLLAEEE